MELRIQPGGQTALATADVARGWRLLTNTFGFCEESRLEMQGDRILRVQPSIRAWPNKFGMRLREYPQDIYGLVKAEWGRIELREEKLQITVNIPAVEFHRLPRSGLPGFYQKPTELDRQGRIGLWFSLLIVLLDGAKTEYPDIMEWDTQFLMAGRPGSSRRH